MAPLSKGQRLGVYKILAPIGSGGMGEVYRARDTTLGHDVALKLLSDSIAKDRVARFEREARTLARLNHPHIATLHRFENLDGRRFFTMELVDGTTLANRLRRDGPFPLKEAVAVFSQIAAAVEIAHSNGIVHRDLKPANVMVTSEDKVKVLDFGLAKMLEPETGSVSDVASTTDDDSTGEGKVLGTPGYMSPEQTRGEPVNEQTDIWAFGCCLYEALTGQRAFKGATAADVASAVLTREPDWGALPAETTEALAALLRRCLAKTRRDRFHHIGDVRLDLDALTVPATPTAVSRRSWRFRSMLATAGVILLATGWGIGARLRAPSVKPRPQLARFPLLLPSGVRAVGPPGVSPDGTQIVMSVTDAAGKFSIWSRRLEETHGRTLIDAGTSPFFDPSGQMLGWHVPGQIRRMRLADGSVQTLAELPERLSIGRWGASWGSAQTILVGSPTGLWKLPATGGALAPATELDLAAGDTAHCWPHFLPDGEHYLFQVASSKGPSLHVGALHTKAHTRLLADVSNALYVPPGRLLYVAGTSLVVQAFDPVRRRLEGDPVRVMDGVVRWANGSGFFGASETGALVVATATHPVSELVWFDRRGRRERSVGSKGRYASPALSPDERLLAVERYSAEREGDIWVLDLVRGGESVVVSTPLHETAPVWSPDGASMAFTRVGQSHASGDAHVVGLLHRSPSGEERALVEGHAKWAADWSSDFILYRSGTRAGPLQAGTVQAISMSAGDMKPIWNTNLPAQHGRFSPDGRWVAYVGLESGRPEVYIERFPQSKGRRLLSTAGGMQPFWRGDGREIFYLSPEGLLMAVALKTAPAMDIGSPVTLFQTPLVSRLVNVRNDYVAAANGQRFLMLVPDREASQDDMTLVLNWTELLGK
jgi:serine/threonine protein kinase